VLADHRGQGIKFEALDDSSRKQIFVRKDVFRREYLGRRNARIEEQSGKKQITIAAQTLQRKESPRSHNSKENALAVPEF
jgi:hypothetical protein